MMRTTDVVVMGAGPVGTVAALALARHGIDVVLCEAGAARASDLRASTFHPPTLEILETLGIVDPVIDYGLKAPVYHFRKRQTGEFVAFDFGELDGDTAFPFRIQCEQHVMAGIAEQRLREEPNITVLYGHRGLGFEQNADHVDVTVETPFEIERIRANYVIAADGGSSTMRKWTGIEFRGFTYPEKFLCLSTAVELADEIENIAYVNYVADPEEWLVLLRVPSVWRILVPADEDASDEFLLSDEKRDDVFRRLIGRPGVPTWHRTIYRVHQRVAARFDHGRVFLAGDAAHLNNPLGGFGMNSGIHDVWNLHEKILQALRSGHDPELFRLYDRQRRTVTEEFVQRQTIQNKQLLDCTAEGGVDMRFAQMEQISADAGKRHDFLLRQSMIESVRRAQAID
jgi:3-(3-hydroxy-phenyl)propionate hydroxylase